MKILVVSNSCSVSKYRDVCRMRKKPLVDPQQKFFQLLTEGIACVSVEKVEALSALPVSASTVSKYFFRYETDDQENLKYHYIPFLNGKIMRYITLALSSYFYTKNWIYSNKSEEKWIIVDPLSPMLSIPCRVLAQKKGVKVAAVITDIPSMASRMKNRRENIFKQKCLDIFQYISDMDLSSYDAYIPLAESINAKVNIKNKPYCVVEGFADSKDITIEEEHDNYIMYAGGVYAKYGVNALVHAFLELHKPGIQLFIFGDGSYVDELKRIEKKHPDVVYKGCVSADEVVKYEKKALLLVNPRPTDEDFAKFSFPSKTMEYLLSGTAVVSTRLPGIPDEYFEHMYSFTGYTAAEIRNDLEKILDQPRSCLYKVGREGHDFVAEKKNNVEMSRKIVCLLKNIHN